MPTLRLQRYGIRARQRCVIFLFSTMTVLMGRILQVRSWIPSQGLRFHRGLVGYGKEISAKNVRNIASSSQLFEKFNVGESVTVRVNKSLKTGIIHEARGGGWYTVQLQNATATDGSSSSSIIKCRSTQMGPLDSSDMTKSTTVQTSPASNPTGPIVTSEAAQRPKSLTNIKMFSAPNPERPLVHPGAGKKPEFPPPPPTIYDLDAALLDRSNVTNARDQELLKQVEHHSKYEKWVVFTDLHCSPASLDTCLDVLTKVHALAVEQAAGVLFLGDFWHHRGTLRVDCLNSILEHFRGWTVPMVMIPGNHDQVTLDGHSHSLTLFENAYRVGDVSGPLIFSYPTKFRKALFVPHIRDIATMESILQSPEAMEASALFVHAEVTGALMNDLIVSMHGIPPASFPSYKRIYSGHFHKPHTVQTCNDGAVRIEYLGSPYQTTLSEAHQAKSFAILDAEWKCIEYVPINVGRRYFKISSWEELAELQFYGDDSHMGPMDKSFVRSGDRIVASIQRADMNSQASEISARVNKMRAEGIMVEIREIKSTVEQALGSSFVGREANKLEEMSPESTWRAYIAEEEQQRESLDRESAELLLEAGLEILQELQASEEGQTDQTKEITDLSLTTISVQGFGPFRDKVTYPLSNRGLVLLKGRNNDGGSDSNGSGKSSLAMAALWALTGSMDPRRASDGKVSDVINDESKTARVTLDGMLNGAPFTISRTKTATKSGLIFLLDGKDLTTQSAKETQELIEEHLGVSVPILSRTMFHGQHSINELLEATDAKLKEELSLLVPLGLWQTAASLSRAKNSDARKRASEFEGMITMRSQDIDRITVKRKEAENIVSQKQKNISSLEAQLNVEMSPGSDARQDLDFSQIELMLSVLSSELEALEEQNRQIQGQRQHAIEPLQSKLESARGSYEALLALVQKGEQEVYGTSLSLKMMADKVNEVEQKWSIDLSSGGLSDLSVPDSCPTCGQTIASTGDGHSHADLAKMMTQEIDDSIDRRNAAQEKFDMASHQLEERRMELQSLANEKISIERDLQTAELEWKEQLDQLERMIESKQRERIDLSDKIAILARESQIAAKNENAMANLRIERASLDYAVESLANIDHEMRDFQLRLEEMKAEMEAQKKRAQTMSELADLFGQRGVQTFVLQNVVEVLQSCSQAYLDDLSDGAQRLDLSLDAGDRISRRAFVVGADGVYKERALSTLSGGQWRRCSLALTFGFAELVARRGKFRPSMCVLDEPLTHLDQFGRSKVGEVIRKMLRSSNGSNAIHGYGVTEMSTVVIILQDLAAEELDEAFDCIDEVIKENSVSTVKVDGARTT